MLFPWYALTLLAFECQAVVGLRVCKLMVGDRDAHDEAHLMVGEKIGAAIEATGMMMVGRPAAEIVARYREQVAANTTRLLAPSS